MRRDLSHVFDFPLSLFEALGVVLHLDAKNVLDDIVDLDIEIIAESDTVCHTIEA